MTRPWFDSSGFMLRNIPVEAAEDCSRGGQDATESVRFWMRHLRFEIPYRLRPLAIRYLVEFGAWSREDLEAMTKTEIAEKVFWIACGDIMENGLWYGMVH